MQRSGVDDEQHIEILFFALRKERPRRLNAERRSRRKSQKVCGQIGRNERERLFLSCFKEPFQNGLEELCHLRSEPCVLDQLKKSHPDGVRGEQNE